MKKWTYEELCAIIDGIGFAYMEDVISHEHKTKAEDAIFGVAGWTWSDMVNECKRRMQ